MLNSPCEICGTSSLPSCGTISIVEQEQRERAAENLDPMRQRPANRRRVEPLAEQVERLRCIHGGAEQPLHRARDRSRSATDSGQCRRQGRGDVDRAACAGAVGDSAGVLAESPPAASIGTSVNATASESSSEYVTVSA